MGVCRLHIVVNIVHVVVNIVRVCCICVVCACSVCCFVNVCLYVMFWREPLSCGQHTQYLLIEHC